MEMSGMKRKDDDFNEEDVSPFDNIRKNIVLREAKCFSDKELSVYKSCVVIIRLLYLMQHGEQLTAEEATDLFFAATKLFQSNDLHLRRLTYLLLKDLNSVESENALIVVSCLNKDMTSKTDLFRANSIRVLSKIIDGQMLAQLERFFKQNLIDRNAQVSVAVLVMAQQLYRQQAAADVIKRWVTEIQEQLNNTANPMVNYHALALLLKIKANDRLAVNKLIVQLAKQTTPSSSNGMQQILYIRVLFSSLRNQNPPQPELVKILRDAMKSKFQMVQYEAARAVSELQHAAAIDMIPCITVLQDMLTSQVPTHRFAALRTLNTIVLKYPAIITPCIVQLETLINDTNRSIATLAITVLLKTGNESNIEKLIKNISQFITEINDEFKIVLIGAVESLALKFPQKATLLLNFLASALREEGGYKYKKTIVDTVLNIVSQIQGTTDIALDHFCEFIEDCEYPELSIIILHLLGEKGISMAHPSKYIRFIFNRCILETASVRAAAVSSLAQFALHCPTLTNNVTILLQRSLTDNDDEVRDRAKFYLHVLATQQETDDLIKLQQTSLPPLHSLEYSINQYMKHTHNTPFSLQKHVIDVGPEKDEMADMQDIGANGAIEADHSLHALPSSANANSNAASSAAGVSLQPYIEQMTQIPEMAQLGDIWKSVQPVDLTEAEAEYVVQCIKHITPQHVIFQFIVHNNMDKTELTGVTVEMECEDDAWNEEFKVAETSIKHNSSGVTYVVFNRPSDTYVSGAIPCRLQFTTHDLADGAAIAGTGAEDEYQLEDIEVIESDFVRSKGRIGLIEFKSQWGEDGDKAGRNEVEKRYQLSLEPLQDIVTAVLDATGCTAVEDGASVADGVTAHVLHAVGRFYPDVDICVRAQFVVGENNTRLKLLVRSGSKEVSTLVASAIR